MKVENSFGSLIVQVKGDCLVVQLPKYFRDNGWADNIGDIQKEIGLESKLRKILFDFRTCRWIDPLPLMSLLLEIATARYMDISVEILLPKPDTKPPVNKRGPYQESPNRMLLFLAQEGFLDCLDSLGDRGISFSKTKDDLIDYRKIQVRPSYEDMGCIPMKLFTVPTEGEDNEFAKMTVEILLRDVDSRLEANIPPHARERLIYKLHLALQELLHNVQEHAYEVDMTPRLITVYVRYRTGGLGLDLAGKQQHSECIKEEKNHCPRLDKNWINARSGCLEVFVLDRGIGMVRSFAKAGIKLIDTYPFREVVRRTFIEGNSTKQQRQTQYGGLHLLHNLLKETGDYIRMLEGGIWLGFSAPILRLTSTISYFAKNFAMHGLAMHLRLGWKEETDQGSTWASFGHGEKSEVWSELILDEEDCADSFVWFENQTVIDERFGDLKIYKGKGEMILWLIRPHRMKWDILSFIERNVVPLSSEAKSILIIADIQSYEAETYAAALSKFKVSCSIDWPSKFSRIILATNRLRFASVEYGFHDINHGFSCLQEDFKKIRINTLNIRPSPGNFRLGILRWLKWHDSRRLWEEVWKNKQMFIAERISWGNMKNVEGYLDFLQTSHNSLCAAIYRTALARALGVLPPNKFELFPLDRLIMAVLREIHATEVYEPTTDKEKTRVALGSVLLSGSTLESSSTVLDLHFFIHYNSPLRKEKPSLLFWLPKDNISKRPSNLVRIGKTAVIAPEGWKSFEIPRFDNQGKCVGIRNPQKTYQDWQSLNPVIVKSGHWSYEGHHDFLTVNIASAVGAAFLEKNELANYLVSRILPFIGISKAYIDENWHRLIEWKGYQSPNTSIDYGILVFRSHPSSESIVRRLLDLLKPEGQELALSRIFPVLPVRMRWGGSAFLIPPLVRENIRVALKFGNKTRPVLLFDDAAITGRTLHDLRTALRAIGATQISTMVIVNRLRLPFEKYGEERLDYYWRLDVPVMGREGNCPLCHALHLAESFSHSLTASYAKAEIRKWLHKWGETSPLNNWSHGLRPLPLVTPERDKEYCYRQNLDGNGGEYFSRIDLIRSTGLAVHATELHAMTGRDDNCLKKIEEHTEPEIRIELASAQILLFGNEFTPDYLVRLISTLIQELTRLKENSQHASLAALAAIGGLGLLDIEKKHHVAQVVQGNGLELRSNYVTRILLAYLVLEDLIAANSEEYNLGKRLLSTHSWTLATRFKAWFLETLSPRGNAHSEAIPVLIDELTQVSEIKKMQIIDAMDSLEFLTDIVEGLEKFFVRKEALNDFSNKKNTIKESAKTVIDYLSKGISGDLPNRWHQETKQALEAYIINMNSIAEAFFHRIPSTEKYWREKTFQENAVSLLINRINWENASSGKKFNSETLSNHSRVIKFSPTGEINFDSNAGEVWIVWHRFISGIVLDLMRNAVYAQKPIPDPWDLNQSDQSEKADLWMRIDYQNEFVDITLVNSSKSSSETVFHKLKKKDRWSHLIELGGNILPAELPARAKEGKAGVRVRIPYAAYLIDN
jgi:hypothetical protein